MTGGGEERTATVAVTGAVAVLACCCICWTLMRAEACPDATPNDEFRLIPPFGGAGDAAVSMWNRGGEGNIVLCVALGTALMGASLSGGKDRPRTDDVENVSDGGPSGAILQELPGTCGGSTFEESLGLATRGELNCPEPPRSSPVSCASNALFCRAIVHICCSRRSIMVPGVRGVAGAGSSGRDGVRRLLRGESLWGTIHKLRGRNGLPAPPPWPSSSTAAPSIFGDASAFSASVVAAPPPSTQPSQSSGAPSALVVATAAICGNNNRTSRATIAASASCASL
mmetsp:Transcript_95354/g.212101  ORF Transcript_95354/g.212101 Transcript_95354/m.212101 type:complete len:284 (+) Transcript_95354:92-943(+)